jgi:hypothetical protein
MGDASPPLFRVPLSHLGVVEKWEAAPGGPPWAGVDIYIGPTLPCIEGKPIPINWDSFRVPIGPMDSDAVAGVIVAAERRARLRVQRDWDLIRSVMHAVQAKGHARPELVTVEGVEPWLVQRHVEMLDEAGFLASVGRQKDDDGVVWIMVRDLSWDGHDFIGSLDNEGVWSKVKQTFSAKELATLPLTIVREVAMKLFLAWAMQKAGFPNP